MSAADGKPNVERLRSVASHDADMASDDADEQTRAGEKAHKRAQKKAKTAGLRAEEAEEEHVASLKRRIDVLQRKLDDREGDLRRLLPRNAELEQAARTSKLATIVEVVGFGVGALLLGIAPFTPPCEWYRYILIGAGVSATSLAILTKVLHTFCGWPPKTATRD